MVIISYIRKKSYDYVLLDTMGLKKKHRYMFIGFEYAGIIFSSVTGGLILGKILAECAKTVLQNIFYNTITTEVNYGFVALRNTLVISCEVFGILFIVFDEVIACLGMDALLTVGKKNGKPLKKRPKTLLIGRLKIHKDIPFKHFSFYPTKKRTHNTLYVLFLYVKSNIIL